MVKTRSVINSQAIVLTFSVLLLTYLGLTGVVRHFPLYDDAYNASIAKNIALGYGYISSYDQNINFNPEVTTGPTLILPAALGIHIFGNKYWVPAFSTLIICLFVFIGIETQLLRLLKETGSLKNRCLEAKLLAVISLGVIILLIPEITSISLLGEFPASLFTCCGTLILFIDKPNAKRVSVAALVLGMAILTKTIMVIPVFVVGLVFLAYTWNNSADYNMRASTMVRNTLLLASGLLIPNLLFESWKYISLGPHQYYLLKVTELGFIKAHGSGINEISLANDLFTFVLSNIKQNYTTITQLNQSYALISLSAVSGSALLISAFFGLAIQKRWLISALHLSWISLFSWWLLLHPLGWYRTVSPVIPLCVLTIVLTPILIFRKRAFLYLIIFLVCWVGYNKSNIIETIKLPEPPLALIDSANSTIDYLNLIEASGKQLLGCGWWANRSLEYLMPGTLNFKNCHLNDPSGAVLVIEEKYWNWEKSEQTTLMERTCSTLVFTSENYKVYKCPD